MANHEVFVMLKQQIAAKEADGFTPDQSIKRWHDSLAGLGHDRPV